MEDHQKSALPSGDRHGAMGVQEEKGGKEQLDFVTALILIVVSVATVITSIGYWQKQRCVFYESAGFMPTVIAGALFIMALMLLRDSLRGANFTTRLGQCKVSFLNTVKSRRVHKALIGLIIFALYVYVLLGRLSFWLASLITLTAVEVYTHWDGQWKTVAKMVVVSALSVAGIVALFQYAFSVPMP